MARRYSSEYKALQPYVVEDARKVAHAVLAGAASGGGGGGLVAHTIYGSYHTGELLQSQASWAATKAELSNHAALPDVHHAKLHGITDSANHSVTGSTYQIVGLTSTNTLGLLTPASSPGANAIVKTDSSSMVTLVDLTVSSDLFVTGYLDFGTDTMYEDASYLQVAGSKAVRFGQNIGNANWTVYNTGGASFGGNVDITSGGDLTVAGSGSYAGSNVLFADSSGGNVGILCVPDSQFALDINGPARATYWIGPHAIQLKNVLMLCHYDGREPLNTNFTGDPNGHMGQIATVTGGVVFRQGKYYKALQIAAATTNLVTNPSFEGGTTGWTWTDSNASGSTPAATNTYGYYHTGTAALRLSNTTSNENDYMSFNVTGLAASTTYTISAWCRVVSFTAGALSNRGLTAYDLDNTSTLQTTTITATADEWVRHVVTVTTTATAGSHTIQIRLYAPQGYVLWDSVQCEALAYASPYCDGTLAGYDSNGVWLDAGNAGTGHGWTGTAHASTSSRAAGVVIYPTAGNLNPNVGTIMAWVNPAGLTGAAQTVLRANGTTAGNIILRLSTAGYPQAYAGTAAVTYSSAVTANTWTHLAMSYDGVTARIYVNGVEVTNGASSGFSGLPTTMYVGCHNTADKFNGLIDDLVIVERVMPASEIRSVYESNAPVFAETSTFSFRPTPKQLIWADDEGMWMRDSAGNPVLGIYGGDAATKSWGGFTMAAGDIVFGRNAVGSSAIWWDQSAGTFGFYGAGSGTAQASVATDGSITAGAGALALNSSGIQITAPSTQSDIGAYKFLVTGKTITSGMYAYYNSGADTYYHGLFSDSSNIGNITTVIGSNLGGGGTSKIQLITSNNLAVSTTTYAMISSTATWHFPDSYIGIGTAAAPTRAFQVNGGLFTSGAETGLAGYVQYTGTTDTTVSTGVGTVKMNAGTARDSNAWVKIFIGTTAYWLPAWSNID